MPLTKILPVPFRRPWTMAQNLGQLVSFRLTAGSLVIQLAQMPAQGGT